MNHKKEHIDIRASKKVKKAVRLSPRLPVKKPEELSDTLTVAKFLKKYPKKMAAKDKSVALPAIKRAELKKKKHKTSKRTSPSDTNVHSDMAHVKPEGLRWIKNLKKQSIDKTIVQTKHMAKLSNKKVATRTKARTK